MAFFTFISMLCFSLAGFNPILLFVSIFTILIVLYKNKGVSLRIVEVLFFLALFLLPVLFSIFTDGGEIYENSLIKYFLYIMYLLLLFISVKNKFSNFKVSLYYVLVLNVFIFYIQVFSFFIFNEFIEFSQYVRAEHATVLYETKALADSFIPVRFTGLFSEPSFYCMLVLPLSFLFFVEKKHMKLSVFSLCSVGLSMSVAAVIILAILLLIYFLKESSKIKIKLLVLSFTILTAPFYIDFYDKRINSAADYDAIGSRAFVFRDLNQRNGIEDFFGYGVFIDEDIPLGTLGLSGAQVRDSSFFIYLLFSVGIIGMTVLIGLLFSIYKLRYIVYILPLLLFKYHLLSPFLFIMFFAFYFFQKEGSNDE